MISKPSWRLAAAINFAAILSGCVSNAGRQMRALPTSRPLLSHVGEAAFDSADKWSFTQAVVRYPASGSPHLIPVGDYLLEQMVAIGDRHGGVTNISVRKFDSTSRIGFGLSGRHLATLDALIAYRRNGSDRVFHFTVTDVDVGAVIADDKSVIPFTSYGHVEDERFHTGVKRLLAAMLAAFDAELGSDPAA